MTIQCCIVMALFCFDMSNYNVLCSMKKYFTLQFFLLFLLVSCDSDVSDVAIYLDNITSIGGEARSGDVINLKIKSSANDGVISLINISSFDSELGSKSLFDTIPNVDEFAFEYDYTMPSFNKDSLEHQIILKAWDNHGNEQRFTKKITVVGGSKALIEKSGLMLNAGNSGKENAFSLTDPSQTFLFTSADSAKTDIYAYADNSSISEVLSGELRTMTDVEFVRINTFDYINATSLTIKNAYTSSKRSNNVRNIQRGDIILVGRGIQPWGVFLVVLLYDEDGTSSDGYMLNYKSIE